MANLQITNWHRCWKAETAKSIWNIFHDTPQNRAQAIEAGAMFISEPALSAPYADNGPEPRRRGDLVLDLDSDDLGLVQEEAKQIVENLVDIYGIDASDVDLFLSGRKGMHLIIPTVLFGVPVPGEELLSLIYKRIVATLTAQLGLKTVDMSMYCMKRGKMLRVANVQRSNGNYKVPLSYDELLELSVDELVELTAKPRLDFQRDGERPFRPNGLLAANYERVVEMVRAERKIQAGVKPLSAEQKTRLGREIPGCIRAIIETLPQKSEKVNFNILLIHLVLYFRDAGHGAATAMSAVAPFLDGYPHSKTYSTLTKRHEAWAALWAYLHGNDSYRFGCSYMKGLGLPGNAFECKLCPSCPDEPAFEPLPDEELSARSRAVLRDLGNPCSEFDTSVLPDCVREFIDAVSDGNGISKTLLLMSFLTTASGFMRQHQYFPERSPENPGGYYQDLFANLWTLGIAPSGFFKTTGLNKGGRYGFEREGQVKGRVRELENLLKTPMGAAPREYRGADGKLLEGKDLAQAKKDEDQSIEAVIVEERKRSVFLPNRTTIEALLDKLSKGFAGTIRCSEFGAWLQGLEKNYNSDMKAMMTDLYDVPSFYNYSTLQRGDTSIERPFINISGVSTIDWVAANISATDVNSGFFARFLIFAPPQTRNVPSAMPRYTAPPNPFAVAAIQDALENMEQPKKWTLSLEARDAFEAVNAALYDEFYKMAEHTQKMLDPFIKRWVPSILKISMILQPFIDADTSSISQDALAGATAVVEYSIKSTMHLFARELGESEDQRKQRCVLEFIAKHSGKVQWRRVLQSKRLQGGSREYDEVLTTLIDSGQVDVTKTGPKSEWLISLSEDKEKVKS